jgi:prepilin-type N-terminal cleavage/methylation domain-containing protein
MRNEIGKKGFTLLEVLTVIVIIGILAALAYSSFADLIQTNKAKETAREMTAFIERSIATGHTRKEIIEISVTGNNTIATKIGTETAPSISQTFANSFTLNTANKPADCATLNFSGNKFSTGTAYSHNVFSNAPAGCFVFCNAGNYCAAAVKTNTKNTFTAQIKKKNSTTWEALL